MKPRELEKLLLAAGWRVLPYQGKGSHRRYCHPAKPGMITIPWHQSRDIPKGIVQDALKKAGLR
jgi:predicted RNA binding protein YcfA (HicA-like mRNA interferase family)